MSKTFGSLLEVARIQSEINRLFDNLLDLEPGEKGGGSWIPNADIVENDESLVVKVELPGVEAGRLAISVRGGTLVLEARRSAPLPTSPRISRSRSELMGRFAG
jgi:HSP20 family protein